MFDLKKLQGKVPTSAPAVAPAALEEQLVASVAAVQINRPASDRPLVVHSIEGSAAALAMLGYEAPGKDDSANTPSDVTEDGIDAVEDRAHAVALAEQRPKARRGRPRKNTTSTQLASGADTAADSATTAGAPDPKAQPGATTIAPKCVPSAGDLAVAVRALIDAITALECHGKTGRHLADAQAAVGRGGAQ